MARPKNEESETKKTENFLLDINRLLNEFFLFTENNQIRFFIQFVIEFQLIFTSKKQKRFSSELLMVSYVIFSKTAKRMKG